jgi:superfamily I DNA and/or RNA helicase
LVSAFNLTLTLRNKKGAKCKKTLLLLRQRPQNAILTMTVPRPLAIDATAVIRAFCAQQREWLELELQSEQDETALGNRKGSSNNSNSNSNSELTASVLSNLQVAEVSVGLYGRTVVRLESAADATSNGNVGDSSSIPLLPAHRLTTGDEVEFRSKSGSKKSSGSASSAPTGVVSQVTETSISVALSSHKQRSDRNTKKGKEDDNNNDDSNNNDDEMLGIPPPFSLIPKSSAQVHRKMMIALEMLERHGVDHPVSGRVVQALFDPQQQREQQRPSSQQLLPLQNSMLDDSQLEAIQFSLAVDRPVSLIHGPPGTGKTTTVVSLIQYAVHTLHWRVLVVAPSNVAVDNVLERLVVPPREQRLAAGSTLRNSSSSKHGSSKNGSAVQASSRIRAIRLGHPARLQASILPYSLEALVQAADGTEIVADVRQELQAYLAVLAKPRSRGKDKRVAYQEMKVLRKEIRTREEKVVSELLQSAQVVLATCVGADNRLLRNEAFDLVVIDEAAQALEAACWIPVLKAKKVVLAGDHCQLPPTVKSNMPKVQKGLSQTMFERVMDLYRDSSGSGVGSVSRMLKVQYRMHKSIADWASQVS